MEQGHRADEVSRELAGLRLDAGVRRMFGLSWGRARAFIAAGKIRCGGETCTDPARRLCQGEIVELDPCARRPRPLLDLLAGAIVYLDEHLVVIDKPAGLSTVPFAEGERDTIQGLLGQAGARRQRGVEGPAAARPRTVKVVHRLDRETSGLMVFARTRLARERLAEQFRAHTVARRYLAIAHGVVFSQTIRSHLLRDRGDGLRGSRERASAPRLPQAAKIAVTHVRLLESMTGRDGRASSLVECRLETGRTHQIRIHLGELGHPLLGERAYVRDYGGELLPAPRLMLHAAELGLRHPRSGKPMHWETPMPPDMQELLARLRSRAAEPLR
jgi:23S rRNA pseudouridine1911/1915/1917 synthase